MEVYLYQTEVKSDREIVRDRELLLKAPETDELVVTRRTENGWIRVTKNWMPWGKSKVLVDGHVLRSPDNELGVWGVSLNEKGRGSLRIGPTSILRVRLGKAQGSQL